MYTGPLLDPTTTNPYANAPDMNKKPAPRFNRAARRKEKALVRKAEKKRRT